MFPCAKAPIREPNRCIEKQPRKGKRREEPFSSCSRMQRRFQGGSNSNLMSCKPNNPNHDRPLATLRPGGAVLRSHSIQEPIVLLQFLFPPARKKERVFQTFHIEVAGRSNATPPRFRTPESPTLCSQRLPTPRLQPSTRWSRWIGNYTSGTPSVPLGAYCASFILRQQDMR